MPAIVRGSLVQAIDDLLRRLAAGDFHPWQIPTELMRFVRAEDVDAVMAALPEDAREIVIAWIQETFTSWQPTVRISPHLARPDVHAALCDWVRRQGRFHWPRRLDEPDLREAELRLGAPEDTMTRLRRSPGSFLSLVRPHMMGAAIAGLPDEERMIFMAWARQTFASGQPLPEPRPWKARPGSEDALRALLCLDEQSKLVLLRAARPWSQLNEHEGELDVELDGGIRLTGRTVLSNASDWNGLVPGATLDAELWMERTGDVEVLAAAAPAALTSRGGPDYEAVGRVLGTKGDEVALDTRPVLRVDLASTPARVLPVVQTGDTIRVVGELQIDLTEI